MTRLLIDGDQFVFKACAAVERETRWDEQNHVLSCNEEEAWDNFKSMMRRINERFETEDSILCFSSAPNFRLKVDPLYKANRVKMRKPLCYGEILYRVRELHYPHHMLPCCEADDVMGVLATEPGAPESIIVSHDKDMKTVPCTLWDGENLITYSKEEADYWHLFQTLVGDSSDGYKGCPGIGAVKAEKLLAKYDDEDAVKSLWTMVIFAYEKAGLTEEDALRNARLARILRHEDWDDKKQEPKLWLPY